MELINIEELRKDLVKKKAMSEKDMERTIYLARRHNARVIKANGGK